MREYVEKPTGVTRTFDGVTFACWATGIGKTEYRNDTLVGRAWFRRNYKLTGYHAGVDSDCISSGKKSKLFRTDRTAALAAMKLRRERK